MRRIFDRVDAAARRQIFRRHVLPRLAAVSRDVHGAIVRSRPEHAGLEARRAHRVQRRVHFLARHVARDRLARRHLALRSVRGHVRTEPRPVQTAVDRLMHVLRAVIHDSRVVRIDLDRRLADEAISHVLRVLAVALLRVDPVVLLLAGVDVIAAEFALAVAVDDFSVGRRPDLAALTTRCL